MADPQALLERICQHHDRWLGTMELACGPGCATCCTQSVTMTSLEGERLLSFLGQAGREAELATLPWRDHGGGGMLLTTNAFAAACLRGEESEEDASAWNLAPCPFLRDARCTVYPARPFGCRAFVSLHNCAVTGCAEVPPLVVTVNTVFLQLIEHLDQGRPWGGMAAVFAWLIENGSAIGANQALAADKHSSAFAAPLRVAQPLPGLLVPPEEEMAVRAILEPLLQDAVAGSTVAALLGLA